MNFRSILTKTIAVASLTIAGVAVVDNLNTNDVQAAIVENDAAVYKVYESTVVYNDYQNPEPTGQILDPNTSWKVIKTAYDAQGNKWYDLGKNQWVKVVTYDTTSYNSAVTYNSYQNYNNYSQNTTANNGQSYAQANTQATTNTTSSYTSSATGSEASAKAWIANRESGGSYTARNGQYIGKYQLSSAYLNGDYSATNQERVADNYVQSRYGSWTAAKNFWLSHGWY